LEFAAFEKDLLEHGTPQAGPVHAPVQWQAPISEPSRHSVGWMLAGAGMAATAAVVLLLASSGLLGACVAAVLRIAAPA